MTIRWKLNFSVIALIAIFLAAAGFSVRAVTRNAEQTRAYSRMRDSAQFTADLRTQIYQRLAARLAAPDGSDQAREWVEDTLDHIDVQIRLAQSVRERRLWQKVSVTTAALGSELSESASPERVDALTRQAEADLLELRSFYDLAQSESIVETAHTSLLAQTAIGLACMLTVLLFLAYLFIIRRWLIRPIQILKEAAEVIGSGRLEHRVPLAGRDELAELARRFDTMAERLSQHQAALLRARELSTLGELCANVAHGLRNPLAALRAGAQLAERRAGENVDTLQLIRELAQQADRLDQRITRLFQFSRPLELRKRLTTFGELASAAQAQAFPVLRTRNVSLRIEDRTGAADLTVDCEQCAESLTELVCNAAHHSAPGAEIHLMGELLAPTNGSGSPLQVQVIDTGAGMPRATREKAFDLFFTSRPEGTGMGLALVRRFVERCGGSVDLASEPGMGTTVTLVLPACAVRRDHAETLSA